MNNFKNGNIISLSLRNFQTFTSQSFKFGSSLNLIAAPNGSGKSSIANAIALLFNGSPKTIGKSKQITEFIKFGCSEAEISAEIAYKGRSIRVSRKIQMNSTYFFINGVLTAQKEYYKLLDELKINVNNLCTFLPQERVGEFCRMDSQELLLEVLKGRASYTNEENEKPRIDLSRLKDLYTSLEEVNLALSSTERKKSLMENALNNLEENMKELREKEINEFKLKKLEYFKFYLEYQSFKKNYISTKKEIEAITGRIRQNEDRIRNVENTISILKEDRSFQDYKKGVDILSKQNQELKDTESSLRNSNFQRGIVEVDKENLIKTREKEKAVLEEQKLQIQSLKENIEKAKNSFAEECQLFRKKIDKICESPEFSSLLCSNYQNNEARIKISKTNMMDSREMCFWNLDDSQSVSDVVATAESMIPSTEQIDDKLMQIRTSILQVQHISKNIQMEIEELEQQRIAHSEQGHMRMEMLKKYHYDTYKGVVWLRSNKVEFKDEILEPSYLHINVDERYREYVEAFLSFQALSSFITKNDEDFNKLTRLLKSEQNLSINVAMLSSSKIEGISRNHISLFNLDGVVSDFIDCRSEYIDFFNVYGHFNCIPILKSNSKPNDSLELEIFKKLPNVKRMAICGRFSEIRRSKYSKDYTVITSRLYPKGIFKFPKIDIEHIKQELFRLNKEREANKGKIEKMLEEKSALEGKKSLIRREFDMSAINTLAYHLKKHIGNLNYAVSQLEARSHNSYESDLELMNCKILDKKAEFSKIVQRAHTILDPENIPKFNLEKVKDLKLDLDNHRRSVLVIQHQNIADSTNLEGFLSSKNSCIIAIEGLKSKMASYPKYESFDDVPKSLIEVNSEMSLLSAKLAVITKQDHVKKDYKQKETQLKDIFNNLDSLKNAQASFEKQYLEEKEKMEREIGTFLGPIREAFKAMFRKLDFEGDLVVNTSGREWELEIFVKFRPEEELQKLSSFRQSGGEKSLSTILFLLALQQCETVPFRLTDEINQGMDPYNERMVFEILKDMSVSSQFFIITPKLVDGLDFSDNTKALIIYGGTGITKDIEEYSQFVLS